MPAECFGLSLSIAVLLQVEGRLVLGGSAGLSRRGLSAYGLAA
jgi:hypothetical protein